MRITSSLFENDTSLKAAVKPITDLHVHLRGTITPGFCRLYAGQNAVDPLVKHDKFVWNGFDGFLKAYDEVGRIVSSYEVLLEITIHYMKLCRAEGVRYIEFMLTPLHLLKLGITVERQLEAINSANEMFDDIKCRVIATFARQDGPELAEDMASRLARHANPALVGFGMVGDERCFRPRDFRKAFLKAKEAGLYTTAHAGEMTGPEAIKETIEYLSVDRLGHCISAVTDCRLVERLGESQIGIEICISSNIRTGAVTDLQSHPLKRLFEAGCKVFTATDDPSFFNTTPAEEMRLASQLLGDKPSNIDQINRNAIRSCFCSTQEKIFY